jgi:DNA-binding PadR family transcriptional regulator
MPVDAAARPSTRLDVLVDSILELSIMNRITKPEHGLARMKEPNAAVGRDVDEFLPLSAVEFTVLLVLADGASHGYAIVKDIEQRTDGQISLLPGNLYAILQRLSDSGLIARTGAPDGAGVDRRRRYYAITALGRAVAAAEASRMKRMVEAAAASDLVRDTAG